MTQNRQALGQLEGIGRSEVMAKDPLGFSGVILKQMSALLPGNKAQFYQGQLISEDGRHALIIAKITGAGTDTAVAAKIEKIIEDGERELKQTRIFKGVKFRVTASGAYRAALDNETIAKRGHPAGLNPDNAGHCAIAAFRFSTSTHRPAGVAALDGGNDCCSFRLLLFVQVHIHARGRFRRRDYGLYR